MLILRNESFWRMEHFLSLFLCVKAHAFISLVIEKEGDQISLNFKPPLATRFFFHFDIAYAMLCLHDLLLFVMPKNYIWRRSS